MNQSPVGCLEQSPGDTVSEQYIKRRVDAAGTVRLEKERYYIGRDRHRQTVLLQIDAPQRQLQVLLEGQVIKTLPSKA